MRTDDPPRDLRSKLISECRLAPAGTATPENRLRGINFVSRIRSIGFSVPLTRLFFVFRNYGLPRCATLGIERARYCRPTPMTDVAPKITAATRSHVPRSAHALNFSFPICRVE